MDYDEETHKQYSCSAWSPNVTAVEDHAEIINKSSAKVRETFPYESIPYKDSGATEENHYEIYKSLNNSKTLLIYFHGGYWQMLDLKSSSFMVDCTVRNGINFAAVGYNLSPKVSLDTIVKEVRLALKVILRRYSEMERIYIIGHSCGAHLALISLVFDRYEDDLSFSELERMKIRGLILISGIYDLKPICRTKDNRNLSLNEETAWILSPLRCIERLREYSDSLKVLIVVTEFDSPAYKQQSKNIYDSIRKIIPDSFVSFKFVEGKDHFEVINDIGTAGCPITEILLSFIKE